MRINSCCLFLMSAQTQTPIFLRFYTFCVMLNYNILLDPVWIFYIFRMHEKRIIQTNSDIIICLWQTYSLWNNNLWSLKKNAERYQVHLCMIFRLLKMKQFFLHDFISRRGNRISLVIRRRAAELDYLVCFFIQFRRLEALNF